MEKLIELLNEFNEEMCWHPGLLYQGFGVRKGDLNFIFNHSKFPFIKWLVDNDKIDLTKLDKKSERKPMYSFEEEGKLGFKLFEVYESLLMLLAIQENPIESLCSVLK